MNGMNVVPRSEREGNVVHMSGPRGGHERVRLAGTANDTRYEQDGIDSEEDEDFLALMNSDKSRPEPTKPFQQGGLPGGLPTVPGAATPPSFSRQSSGANDHFEPPAASAQWAGPPSGTEQPSEGSFRSLEEEKQHYVYKIQRLQARYPGRRVGLETPLDELKYEYERLRRQSEMSASIKFQRRTLMAAVTGMEYLNKSFNPLGLHLDGWSEQVMDSLEDYDQTFEQLHDKYQGTAEVSPEWNLFIMVLGSGFMFHLSNSLFKSVLPNVNEVARNNPDLMNQIASAMGNAMGQQTPPSGNPTQMGANLAMQAMKNQAARPTPSIDEDLSDAGFDQDTEPGFEQAASLVQPNWNDGPSMPRHTREDEASISSASEISSDAFSEEDDTRAIRGGTKRPPPPPKRVTRNTKKKATMDLQI